MKTGLHSGMITAMVAAVLFGADNQHQHAPIRHSHPHFPDAHHHHSH